jgi:hypothetical protein
VGNSDDTSTMVSCFRRSSFASDLNVSIVGIARRKLVSPVSAASGERSASSQTRRSHSCRLGSS